MIYLNSSAQVVTCQRRIAEEKNGEQQHATKKVHLDKIQDSIGTPTPKVGVELGVCEFIPSHPKKCV
jgi:hypothetical protein